MPEPLSKMERRILDYIVDYLRRNTYQPSIREIGRRFGIKSTKTVSEHLQALAEKGYIEREASRSRAVHIVGLELQNPKTMQVPLFGALAAAKPAASRERADEEFSLDPKLVGSPESFFIRVRGGGMAEMGILDGDMVLVEPAKPSALREGEVVAASVGGEATLKRYLGRDGSAVLGRVTGLFRRFAVANAAAVGG